MNRDTVAPYNRGFREFSASFDSFRFEELHRGALPFLPAVPGLALDVGAGSGRDARWLAARGWEVVAVEPAVAMREQAASHPGSGVRWLDDRLPALAGVHRLGLAFDLVWLSGVWMHVPPEDRRRAMRKMATLLKPGGRLVMTLRHGPAAEDRPMWPVDAHEVERLGLDFGLTLRVATDLADDLQGRADVRWQTVILDLPDDGAGALPLLRGVILRQEKSATYKLALIRCIARIADASANVARETDEHVELPLGLIALYWIRMYKPLVEHGLPQLPQNRPMAFVTDAFRALHATAPFDLRPGGVFGEDLRHPSAVGYMAGTAAHGGLGGADAGGGMAAPDEGLRGPGGRRGERGRGSRCAAVDRAGARHQPGPRPDGAAAERRPGRDLRMVRGSFGSAKSRHRSLPALVGLGVR